MIQTIYTNISSLDEDTYRILYEKASPERRIRADHYHRRENALRCVTADALLRFTLGTDQYAVKKALQGKPFVCDRPDFFYNISHSGCWVAIAWGSREVGVDVEKIRPDRDTAALCGRFFSKAEQNYVQQNQETFCSLFYEIWTKKESYAKWQGTGLTGDLSACCVLAPEMDGLFHSRMLSNGYWLSVCTDDPEVRFSEADLLQLL